MADGSETKRQQDQANVFVGPGNTSLGPGPVIPESMPSTTEEQTSGQSGSSANSGERQNAFKGAHGMSLGHGPRVDHLPKDQNGSYRLSNDSAVEKVNTTDDGTSKNQESQKNPWRGPGGMKMGHGPRVDHLEKNPDGSFKLQNQSQDHTDEHKD